MIVIDTTSFVPPYEQIRAQIAAQVADGVLVAGTRLPTVRRLAEDLGLAVNTVGRAYKELEATGLVQSRGRGGTVVTSGGNLARERLQEAAQQYATLARDVGIRPQEALQLVRAALDSTR